MAVGRNVYVREPIGAFDRFTQQNNSPLDQERASYKQVLALINGAPMPGLKSPYDLPRARTPFLYPVALSDSGYPGGTYLRSCAWAIKVRGTRGHWLLTEPAPPVEFSVAEDQTTEQPMPQEIAEGADGIAILDSEPGGTELFVQRIVDVRSSAPATYPMDGPPRYMWRAPLENQTYVGPYQRFGGPEVRKRNSYHRILWTDANVSWKFRTAQGWSASQGMTHIEHRYIERNARYEIRPYYIPPSGLAWVLQVQGPDGQWYDVDYGTGGGELRPDAWAFHTVADPEKLDAKSQGGGLRGPSGPGAQAGWTFEGSERSKEDETGIPGPDEALEAPLVSGRARISSGKKIVRTTDVYELSDGREVESPPSAPNSIVLGAQEGFEVDFREFAEEGDVIPNGDFEEQVIHPAGYPVPRRFSYPASPHINLKVSAKESIVTFDDSTGRTTNELIFLANPFRVAQVPHTIRGGVVLDRAQGGDARLGFRFLDSAGTTVLGTRVMVIRSQAGEQIQDYTVGPSGSGCDVIWPEGTYNVSYYCQLVGSAAARNLAGRFIHIGMVRGKAFPRKTEPGQENPVPEAEPEAAPYPPGSYMRVVESPSWAEGKGNGFEYYGSAIALLRRRYFASGLRLPVEANRVYCLQASYYHEGLAEGSEALPVHVTNAAGEVLEGAAGAPGALLSNISGDGSGLATLVVETGPGAAYLEVGESTLGPGFLRAWGFQLEYGTIPSAWTNEVAPSGVIAASFDTRTPGADETLARLFAYKRLTGGGAMADLPAGTSVPVRFRGRHRETDFWSEYFSDITLMPRYRYIEIEAAPATTDLTVSPEISSLFAEAEPPRTVLLRPDGSEYPGGVLVEGMPATAWGENTEETMRSDGVPRTRQLHPSRPDFEGATIKAFSEAAAEAISFDSTHGRRLFLIEGWGKTRLVRMINLRLSANRTERVMGRDVYIHTATDVSGRILTETEIPRSETLEGVQ